MIREFKELKELKRMRRDPRCTSWFCVADTAFKCEVMILFLIILLSASSWLFLCLFLWDMHPVLAIPYRENPI